MRRLALATLALLALLAPGALAQDSRTSAAPAPVDPNALVRPTDLDAAPLGHRLTPKRALAIARAVPKIADMLGRHPGYVEEAYQKGASRWQVSYFDPVTKGEPRKEIGQVSIDDASGKVVEAWTGFQVAWTMARGYPGAFGRIVTSPWIWIPLSILFVLPFVDPRRWRSWLHLDLFVLSAFSISLAFFDHGTIGISVPFVYPLLVYLLIRMVAIALRRGPAPPVRLLVPVTWLAVALIFLLGFRIGLNATNSNVIDVGYAGVIGADRLVDGNPLYGHFPSDNAHGDTYGPVVYEAYVPFEQAKPWSGVWDDLPAAHGAAIAFDLLCVLLLFLLGRQVRGPDLGIALAYAWTAYPFTLYTSNSNSNDSLVAALVLLCVLLAGRPVLRGGAAALAGLTKFAPLALAPLMATHRLEPGRRVRGLALFAAGFVVTAVVVCLPFLGEDLSTFYEHSIKFQAQRGSPFSVWGLYGWSTAQNVVQVLAVLLAVGLALVPRRRDTAGLAAACAAVLIALQLGVTHWFYLYLPWFVGLVLLAVLGRSGGTNERSRRQALDRWTARLREIEIELGQVGAWEAWGANRLPDGSADPAHEHPEYLWEPLVERWSPGTVRRAFQLSVPDWEGGRCFGHVKRYDNDPERPPSESWPDALLWLGVPSPQAEEEALAVLRRWMDPDVPVEEVDVHMAQLWARPGRFRQLLRRR